MNNTPSMNLSRPNFNLVGWHDDVNKNFLKIDNAFSVMGYPSTDGIWANATVYAIDDRLFDDVDGTIWDAVVAHTSAATGTFVADRALHPGYWVQVRSGIVYRGGWLTGTRYRVQDMAYYNGEGYMCLIEHTSGTFAVDLGNGKWEKFVERGGSGLGTGDVTGPVSAVDNRLAAFDGVTGKLIKDSGVLTSDVAKLSGSTFTVSPIMPTPGAADNSTKGATTAYVTTAVTNIYNAILNGVSASFDTLAELAAALGGKMDKTANLGDVSSVATSFANIKQSATAAATGVVELATPAEAQAGTDTVRAVTPEGLAAVTKSLGTFYPTDVEQPTTNYAYYGVRNTHPFLAFDTTTQYTAIFSGTLPQQYKTGGSITVIVYVMAASATAGTIGFDGAFERIDLSTLDLDADSFAATKTFAATAVPGTSGQIMALSVTFSSAEIDGLLVGENFRFRLRRDVANDTAAGDAQVVAVELRNA